MDGRSGSDLTPSPIFLDASLIDFRLLENDLIVVEETRPGTGRGASRTSLLGDLAHALLVSGRGLIGQEGRIFSLGVLGGHYPAWLGQEVEKAGGRGLLVTVTEFDRSSGSKR